MFKKKSYNELGGEGGNSIMLTKICERSEYNNNNNIEKDTNNKNNKLSNNKGGGINNKGIKTRN